MAKSTDIHALIEHARGGEFGPVHVIVGKERFLVERAAGLLKRAALGDGPTGFNDDVFHGATNLKAAKIIAAARTLPMMAQARFILVRSAGKMDNGQLGPSSRSTSRRPSRAHAS